ncbi:MAG: hypothetical protein LBE36_01945 [Flavobacteriaceae bacterium]|nr:hypothetical protein [Flavobacteriaceae bacterium]
MLKSRANFPKQCSHKPFFERTFDAFWMFYFSMSQLKKDSMGCLTFETALEKRVLAAKSLCLRQSGVFFTAFTGVKSSNCIHF